MDTLLSLYVLATALALTCNMKILIVRFVKFLVSKIISVLYGVLCSTYNTLVYYVDLCYSVGEDFSHTCILSVDSNNTREI